MGKYAKIAGQDVKIDAESARIYLWVGDLGLILEDAGGGKAELIVVRVLSGERQKQEASHVFKINDDPAA